VRKAIPNGDLGQELDWRNSAHFRPIEMSENHCDNWSNDLDDNLGLHRQELLPMVNPELRETMRCNPSELESNWSIAQSAIRYFNNVLAFAHKSNARYSFGFQGG
jgi:hypothetical protein